MKKRNIRLVTGSVLAAALMLSPVWDKAAQAATVKADFSVNLRSGGSRQAEKIATVQPGQVAELLDSKDGWFLVSYQGVAGYSYSSFWSAHTIRPTARANLRETAHPQGRILDRIAPATEVIVTGRSGDWLSLVVDGIRGFSHRSNWELSEELFLGLPHVIPAPLDLTDQTPLQTGNAGALPSAGDQYEVISGIPAYPSAKAAGSGDESIGLEPAGNYLVRRVQSGMIELSPSAGSESVWIDPADNKGIRRSEGSPTVRIGGIWRVDSPLPGFITSRDAAAGRDQAVTVTPGTYHIFNLHGGMINVSTDPSVPGAWIDPPEESPPPEKLPGSLPVAPPAGDSAGQGARIVAEAEKLIGAPYILGAESWEEGGFDCSGVTQFVYRQLGITIPRRASQQWAGIGNKVTERMPGDIIAIEKEGRVYHVGIYIGDNRMIHAPKPGDFVKVSDLGWWVKNSRIKGYLRPVPTDRD